MPPLYASLVSPATGPTLDRLPARPAFIGNMELARLLPRRARRTIGPWCFIDHVGPARTRLEVGEHPHIGLQTVTWVLDGEVLHRDSLGNRQVLRPGQLNWMTAGRGITHAEHGVDETTHAIQMWAALPDASRGCDPAFEHHSSLPTHDGPGWSATVLAGEALGLQSAARTFSPLVALELSFHGDGEAALPLNARFEHGLFVAEGQAVVDEVELPRDVMLYVGTRRSEITVRGKAGTKMLLVGGTPFGEPILMWWNFVARQESEIIAARTAWSEGDFVAIPDYDGERIDPPPFRNS